MRSTSFPASVGATPTLNGRALLRQASVVLDEVERLKELARAAHDPLWRNHLDLSKVGIIGHSLGGATAALATQEERRILAGVQFTGDLAAPHLWLMLTEPWRAKILPPRRGGEVSELSPPLPLRSFASRPRPCASASARRRPPNVSNEL